VFEFKLPDLGEGIHEGEILKWHAQVGETVKEDAPLVDVETDKAAVTIPSPRGGKIVSLAGNVGDTVEVGQVIVVIDDAASGAATAPAAASPVKAPATAPGAQPVRTQAAVAGAAPPAPAVVRATGPVGAAPATRRVARELGIDIQTVAGTGPGGRISVDDVKSFASGGGAARAGESVTADAGIDQPSTPASMGSVSGIPYLELEAMPDFASFGPVEREPVRSIRKKVAKRMVTSMVLVPHVAHMDEADVTQLDEFRLRMRKELEGKPGGKISLMPFVMKAVVEALKNYPMFNASLDPYREELVYKKYYNLGIAVDSGKGLIVPVIKGCDAKSVLEVSADVEAIAAKARAGSIEVNDLRGGTFTITNVGSLGGTGLFPTINYPEVAILGMAKAQQRAVVREGQIVIRTIMPLTLAFDHRVADGADAARFMNEIVRRLSDPLFWLMTR
jgi:pyruvate dehydrogenase E2 component (dihydrolipoamide acetyltransferase)